MYGQSYACGTSGARWRVRANNNTVADVNPCDEWSSSGFSWRAFSVPINWISAGTNSFDLYYLNGDWTQRNVYLGIDFDTDYGRSDTSYDGTNVDGELMWYLVLS